MLNDVASCMQPPLLYITDSQPIMENWNQDHPERYSNFHGLYEKFQGCGGWPWSWWGRWKRQDHPQSKCSFYLIVIFSVELQQTEITERKLFIFHLSSQPIIGSQPQWCHKCYVQHRWKSHGQPPSHNSGLYWICLKLCGFWLKLLLFHETYAALKIKKVC